MIRVTLIWIINDFLAYDMLFKWLIANKSTYPICMDDIRAFTLKHARNNHGLTTIYFFLEVNHMYRRNKDAFCINRVKRSLDPYIGDVVQDKGVDDSKSHKKVSQSN